MKNLTLTIIITLAASFAAFGQGWDSDKKVDKNRTSMARVDPATFAMNFSLTLANYPQRGGGSLPVTFNYSSKVWTMRVSDLTRVEEGGQGSESNPFIIRNIASYLPEFSERTSSGWTSSLGSTSILPNDEFFGGDASATGDIGQLFSLQESNQTQCQQLGEPSWSEPTEFCSGGTARYTFVCPDQLSLTNVVFDVCYVGPFPNMPWSNPNVPMPAGPNYKVNRLRLKKADGSTQEFRKDDKVYDCNLISECDQAYNIIGTYLSVDGSGTRLVNEALPVNGVRSTLYSPDGSRIVFDNNAGEQLHIDADGNKLSFDLQSKVWTDTMNRTVVDPLPFPVTTSTLGTNAIPVKGVDFAQRAFTQTWEYLKPNGCVTGTEPECASAALETPSEELFNQGSDTCEDRNSLNEISPSLFTVEPAQEETTSCGLNYCRSINTVRTCGGIFNPIVLTEIGLPNGTSYKFRYNRYGEITKIVYPTGAYERFRYDVVFPLTHLAYPVHQANRGVVERWLSPDGVNETSHWTYQTSGQTRTITEPDGSKTVSLYYWGSSQLGFEEPRIGMLLESKTYSKPLVGNVESSRILLNRTLNDLIVAEPRTGGHPLGIRDARVRATVSIAFENGQALATLSKTEFDDAASSDPEQFPHLNVKLKKSYHYAPVTAANVDDEPLSWSTIESWFPASKLASVLENKYSYDSVYKDRGIIGRPVEKLILDPANPDSTNLANVLAKSEMVYDEVAYRDFNYTTTNWVDPGSALRGNVTTTRTWVKESNTWLESHTMYDNFGNVRKVWDASGDATKYIETVYDSQYKYAYPTSVTTPAPDPTNTTGTNEASTFSTSYDFNTGLPLTVTNDFGQITETEYDDPLLRPTRSFAVNFTAPESQTIYNDTARTVTVRKQLDGGNWDEATTFADTLGRTVKTQARDSQGDVFVETHYDLLGRVERVTNPYRVGDTVYWSKTRYDAAGRAVETYAPATAAEIATAATNNNANLTSLGVTSFAISDVTNFVGTVVTTKDASGRRGRSITNALGQLIRVDEPTGISASETTDLGALATPVQATSYKYDVFGKMVQVTQGVQNRYFKYDALGRLLRVSQPEQERNPNLDLSDSYNTSGHWTAGFAYDLRGNVVRATDANGVNIINDYDRAGRVIRRCYTKPNINTSATTCAPIIGTSSESADTPAVTFWYDGKGLSAPQDPNFAKGKLTKVSSSVSASEYQLFDSFGRATQAAQITDGNTYTSRYTYSFSGALVEEEYPSGRIVKNDYESDGDIARIFGSKNTASTEKTFANTFRYTPDGKIESLRLGNGLWESAKFNNRMQPTEINLGHGVVSGDLWKLTYEYGELETNGTVSTATNTGNIARQTVSFNGLSHPFVQSYKYDALQRLTEAKETKNGTQIWSQQFGYDIYGNRNSTNQSVNGSIITSTPALDANTNRFTSTNFQYDKNGNITRDTSVANASRTFLFNADNKQRQVLDANDNPIGTYYYDGEGKRVKKVTATETTIYVFSGGKLVAEYTNATPPENPTVSYTATDLLGSPRVLTDSLGAVVSRRDFLPFGEEVYADEANRTSAQKYTTTGDDGLRKRFTGYEKDKETQLDFAEARMYDNRYGRFTAVDPLLASGKSGNPQTFNRFVYVMNSPLILRDPTGLQTATVLHEEGVEKVHSKACSQYNFPCRIVSFIGSFFGGGKKEAGYDPLPTSPIPVMQYPEEYEFERRKQSSTVLRGVTPGVNQVSYPFGTPEENERRAEALSMILPGFEMAWTSYNHSNGNATNGQLITSYGMLALSAVPGGKGGSEGAKLGFRSFGTFGAFKRTLGKAGDGMHWHHIVEKHTDNLTKFGGDAIHNTINVIRLPKEIHEKISGHYSSKQAFTGGLTVRAWLKTQTYEEQVKYGIETLKRFGWTP